MCPALIFVLTQSEVLLCSCIPKQFAMGLRMENIHTPSVASGPTTHHGTSSQTATDTLSLMELMAEKDKVESELTALGSVLESVSIRLQIWCRHMILTRAGCNSMV